RVHSFKVRVDFICRNCLYAFDELRKAQRMQLQPKRSANKEGISCKIDKSRCVRTDDAHLGCAQALNRFRECNGLSQLILDILRGAIDELERMICLPKYVGTEMLTNERTGAYLAVARAFGRCP